jgi:hypothetical protein
MKTADRRRTAVSLRSSNRSAAKPAIASRTAKDKPAEDEAPADALAPVPAKPPDAGAWLAPPAAGVAEALVGPDECRGPLALGGPVGADERRVKSPGRAKGGSSTIGSAGAVGGTFDGVPATSPAGGGTVALGAT